MANIFDYLAWRGDLSLRQDPFNEVDNLVLATLSYIDFAGIVPASGEEQLSLAEAQKAYEARHGQEKLVGPGQGKWLRKHRALDRCNCQVTVPISTRIVRSSLLQ